MLNTSYAMTEGIGGYPVINCANATQNIRVFLIDVGNETKVYEKDNCIIIQGTDEAETIKAADALIFDWLKMIRQ